MPERMRKSVSRMALSHSEREMRMSPFGCSGTICQYQPEYTRSKRGSEKRSCSDTRPAESGSAAAINPSRSNFSRESKSPCTEARKIPERTKPPTSRASSVHTAAATISRAERELSLCGSPVRRCVRNFETIAKAAHRLDQIGIELLAQTPDEHLYCIRVAIEILIVKMLDQFGPGNHPAAVMRQIGEQAIFQRGELHRISVIGDA